MKVVFKNCLAGIEVTPSTLIHINLNDVVCPAHRHFDSTDSLQYSTLNIIPLRCLLQALAHQELFLNECNALMQW